MCVDYSFDRSLAALRDLLNYMIKKIAFASLTLAVIVGGAISTVQATGSNQEPTSGSNMVNVDSCVQHIHGVMVGKFGKTPYFLSNGIHDAGYGLRDYILTCTSNTQYKVEWTEVSQPQPVLSSVSTYIKTGSGVVFHPVDVEEKSYADAHAYFGLSQPFTVTQSVQKLMFRVTPSVVSSIGLSYGFGWMTDTTSSLAFNEASAKTIAASLNMSAKGTVTLNVTDFYRGKYVLVYTFVRNNDGVSQVPNMPIEVDDIMVNYLYVEPISAPAVEISCGNSVGGDGLYTGCVGDIITHSSGLKIRVTGYTDTYAHLSFTNGSMIQVYVPKNKKTYIQANNGTWLEITYTQKSAKFGVFLNIKTVQII